MRHGVLPRHQRHAPLHLFRHSVRRWAVAFLLWRFACVHAIPLFAHSTAPLPTPPHFLSLHI